ncbi:MAG: Asp-tRNA(Asn)/Glu-tRNA(Gln) amidotransferase subunit GatC [Chitinispirillia bacterium]|nr:Asp-tRNA(Asn)/Glu-tRNA(Gln) amidotransferase subunit GatC [Chitinispirillia bacterium]MCL2242818.1 Asp-tRNA(Asn)/Glu-tRNA(Gln) amidotransferase subunit GatC [Chitinispirillia bacterium]
MIDREQVLHTAALARLELTEGEIADLTAQLGAIIGHIRALDEAGVSGVEPTCFLAPLHDPLRDDIETPSLDPETSLANGPSVKKGHFAVPKVIGAPGGP